MSRIEFINHLFAAHNLFIQSFFGNLTQNTPTSEFLSGESGFVLASISVVLIIIFWSKAGKLKNVEYP